MKETTKPKMNPLEDKIRDKKISEKLAMMKHKDLQRECVLRGLEFKLVVEWDHHKLSNWFYHNFETETMTDAILDTYDAWIITLLEERGYKKGDAVMHPSLRLGFTPDMDSVKVSTTIRKITPTKVVEEIKPKRTVDEATGKLTGTKKNLTYQLTKAGKTLEEIIGLVIDQFPDAQDKSIKIWYKRCLNGQ